MRRIFTFILIILVSTSLLASAHTVTCDTSQLKLLEYLDVDRAWNTIENLAGDRFEGRLAGTRSAESASEFIASHFDSIGLKPAGADERYRSKFLTPMWQLTQMPKLEMVEPSGGVLRAFEYRKDFAIQPGSGSGNFSAEVVFSGYGITTRDLAYDDYAGISVQGKIVLVIIGMPPGDPFKQGTYGTWSTKADNALKHGAAGLVLIDSPAAPTPNYIERWSGGRTVYQKIAILWATVETADTLLKDRGITLSSIQRLINQDLKPQSFPVNKQLRMSVQVSFTESASTSNVLGFIPGSNPTSKKVVIIGAHYDHLGKDADGKIFRGANDDASGVAVMMEIAHVFSIAAKPSCSLLFAAWSGEEEGTLGSYAYVNHPYFSLTETIAYLNLDMVGYGRQLVCQISEAHKTLRTVLTESVEQLRVSVQVEKYSGGSDHAPFERNMVPNLMFIYRPDEAYHTPKDTADRISRKNLLETARLTALMALKLSEASIATITLTPSVSTTTKGKAISAETTSSSTVITTTVLETGAGETTSMQPFSRVSAPDALTTVAVTLALVAAAGAFYSRRRRKRKSHVNFSASGAGHVKSCLAIENRCCI